VVPPNPPDPLGPLGPTMPFIEGLSGGERGSPSLRRLCSQNKRAARAMRRGIPSPSPSPMPSLKPRVCVVGVAPPGIAVAVDVTLDAEVTDRDTLVLWNELEGMEVMGGNMDRALDANVVVID
jgi:hypothetical protein